MYQVVPRDKKRINTIPICKTLNRNYSTVNLPLPPTKKRSVQYTYEHLEDKDILKRKIKSHRVRVISFFSQVTQPEYKKEALSRLYLHFSKGSGMMLFGTLRKKLETTENLAHKCKKNCSLWKNSHKKCQTPGLWHKKNLFQVGSHWKILCIWLLHWMYS